MSNEGYTLIEIMVTMIIFSLVFGMISGLFTLALKTQRRSLASQELLAQTSYVMEYMSRHLRMAQESIYLPSCITADAYYEIPYQDAIKFIGNESDPCCWEIFLVNERLKRKTTICSSADPGSFLTSDDLKVEEFNVNLDDSGQPRVTLFLKIKGKGEKAEEQPVIKIQNTISQRSLDVE